MAEPLEPLKWQPILTASLKSHPLPLCEEALFCKVSGVKEKMNSQKGSEQPAEAERVCFAVWVSSGVFR